jgi:hypothetical protein
MNIQNSLQSPHLMGHTQLPVLARSLQLSPITIANPHFRWHVPHDISDHFRAAVTADHVVNTVDSAKHPFPGIRSIDPVGCFVAVDHLTLTNAILDLVKHTQRPFPSPLHDLVDPTLADLHLMQVEQCLLRAGIAYMLFLPVVQYYA